MAILKIKSGVAKGAVFALKPGANRIGRADGNDYCLPDISISAVHCEIVLDGSGKLFVRDLGSSNGTFIEGRRVELGVVLGGEKLALGEVEMIYDNRWWNDYSASSAVIPSPETGKTSDEHSTTFMRREAVARD
jgi:predicted component of type VI protein secretion system